MKTLTFGSLFAGIGGFDLGFERAGLRCEWQVEIDPYCRRVLAKHWPNVRRWDDVRTWPQPDTASVDIICGGFPCKQTSTGAAIHDKRKGLRGRDSRLFYEFVRVVQLLQPRFIVLENVGGAATWQETIKRRLEAIGYRLPNGPASLPAEGFGAPHRRRRLFWIADRDFAGLEIARPCGSSKAERIARGAADRNHWLASIPRALRVADGVPGGLDRRQRINAIGNAVVPAVAEWIGKRIVETQAN